MSRVVLGHDEATAGIFVEAMDNSRTSHAADAAQFSSAMVEQGVDERMLFVPGGWMHDDAGGFVQNEQIVVLEKDIERDFLRLGCGGCRFRPNNLNLFRGARGVIGLGGFAVHGDVTFVDQPLNGSAGDFGKLLAQKRIEPSARERSLYNNNVSAHGGQGEGLFED